MLLLCQDKSTGICCPRDLLVGLLSPRSQLARNAGTCLRQDQTVTSHYPGPRLLALNATSRPGPERQPWDRTAVLEVWSRTNSTASLIKNENNPASSHIYWNQKLWGWAQQSVCVLTSSSRDLDTHHWDSLAERLRTDSVTTGLIGILTAIHYCVILGKSLYFSVHSLLLCKMGVITVLISQNSWEH